MQKTCVRPIGGRPSSSSDTSAGDTSGAGVFTGRSGCGEHVLGHQRPELSDLAILDPENIDAWIGAFSARWRRIRARPARDDAIPFCDEVFNAQAESRHLCAHRRDERFLTFRSARGALRNIVVQEIGCEEVVSLLHVPGTPETLKQVSRKILLLLDRHRCPIPH